MIKRRAGPAYSKINSTCSPLSLSQNYFQDHVHIEELLKDVYPDLRAKYRSFDARLSLLGSTHRIPADTAHILITTHRWSTRRDQRSDGCAPLLIELECPAGEPVVLIIALEADFIKKYQRNWDLPKRVLSLAFQRFSFSSPKPLWDLCRMGLITDTVRFDHLFFLGRKGPPYPTLAFLCGQPVTKIHWGGRMWPPYLMMQIVKVTNKLEYISYPSPICCYLASSYGWDDQEPPIRTRVYESLDISWFREWGARANAKGVHGVVEAIMVNHPDVEEVRVLDAITNPLTWAPLKIMKGRGAPPLVVCRFVSDGLPFSVCELHRRIAQVRDEINTTVLDSSIKFVPIRLVHSSHYSYCTEPGDVGLFDRGCEAQIQFRQDQATALAESVPDTFELALIPEIMSYMPYDSQICLNLLPTKDKPIDLF